MSQRHSLVGTGLYSTYEAARLLRLDLRSVRRWLKGSSRKTKNGLSITPPLWSLQYSDDEEIGDRHVLGFKDLMELRVVARLVEQGVALQTVRAAIQLAREQMGPYPLQSRRFLSDGKRIFMDIVGIDGQPSRLLDVQARQLVLDSVIRPSLFDGVEFDTDGNSRRWFPVPNERVVVLDPARCFGEPILTRINVSTETLFLSHRAEGGNTDFVSRIWRVTPNEVMAAVAYEERLAAA
ncbi:DUF433 domain-containing protein [Roseateles sp.]|uniref:DUF433 domain-containing protein n=1 Tax=Roseateles sp. TaxID=1971397 RepID=UPI002F402A87